MILVFSYRKSIRPPFCKMVAILSFSGKTPVQSDWFIVTVSDPVMTCAILFKKFVEMPSAPHRCWDAKFWIILSTVCVTSRSKFSEDKIVCFRYDEAVLSLMLLILLADLSQHLQKVIKVISRFQGVIKFAIICFEIDRRGNKPLSKPMTG